MALCHCDQLYEIIDECDGIENFHHFCQFFGGTGRDGQRVIMYCTNYTTKMSMMRVEMKQMLLGLVCQAKAKSQLLGSQWKDFERIMWIIT